MGINSIDAEDDQFAYRYDTQLLIDRRDEDLDEDEIADYITEHFEGNSLIAADTLNFALLNRTQQTHLHHRRDIANFIEKQRAAIGNFKTTTMGINRTSKCPFVMTE